MDISEEETALSRIQSEMESQGDVFVWQLSDNLDIEGCNSTFCTWLHDVKGRPVPSNFRDLPIGELRFRFYDGLFKKAFTDQLKYSYIPEEYSISGTHANMSFKLIQNLKSKKQTLICSYKEVIGILPRYLNEEKKKNLDSATDKTWFWAVDNRLNIKYLSENAEVITGYKNEERIGRHLFHKRTQSQQEQLQAVWNEKVKRPKPFNNLVIKMQTRNGAVLSVKVDGVPEYDNRGNLTGYRGSATDISEEVKMKDDAMKAEARNEAILEALPDIFFVFNKAGEIVDYHSKSADESIGQSDDFIGKSIYDIWPKKQADFLSAPIHRVMQTGKVIALNLSLENRKGENQYYEARYALISGQEPQVLALLRNVTLSKESQDQLVKTLNDLHFSNRELEQFSYTVSHDLQEPMQLINNFLQIIKMRSANNLDEKSLKFINEAQKSSERMRNLVANLLEYSRLGKQKLNVKEIHFNDLMDSIMQIYNKKITEKNASVKVNRVPNFKGDPLHVSLLLQNLIGNALKFSKPDTDPKIEISGKEESDFIQICVEDNGIGMDSTKVNDVFEIFHRLNDTRHIEGHGLGMSICKKIVTNHGGEIWIESVLHVGTKVFFTMPRSEDLIPVHE